MSWQMSPYGGRGRGFSQWILPAAYVAGQAAPAFVEHVVAPAMRGFLGRGRGGGSRRPPAPTQVIVQTPARGRGRGRRGGKRGRGGARQAAQVPSGTSLGGMGQRVRNTEVLAVGEPKKLQVMQFVPGQTGLPLLDAEAHKFTRYKFFSVSISFKATASTTTSGEMVWGIAPGAVMTEIKAKADIYKLRPCKVGAVWKSDSITIGRNITPQPYLYCDDKTREGVAFTLYSWQDADAVTGVFQITYDVEFSYPNP